MAGVRMKQMGHIGWCETHSGKIGAWQETFMSPGETMILELKRR